LKKTRGPKLFKAIFENKELSLY